MNKPYSSMSRGELLEAVNSLADKLADMEQEMKRWRDAYRTEIARK